MEIIVDCYGEDERAMGWYCYLQDKLTFPFLARCIARRVTSPLKVGDEVEVLKMAPDEECEREMFVMVRWEREGLAVPLSQLEVIHTDDETEEAARDWLYWTNKGYWF
jgi:Calcium binding